MIKPLISVCLFTRNPEHNLFLKVLDSLKKQTLPINKWELVVIENSSKSYIFNRYKNIISKNFNMKIINESRKGFYWCQRRGILESTADLILFIADDCVVDKNYLKISTSMMNKKTQVGVLTGNIQFTTPEYTNKFTKRLHDSMYHSGIIAGYYQTSEKTKFTQALRGSAGMIVRREIGIRFCNRDWIYKNIENRLKNIKNNIIHGSDLDFPMIALQMKYYIARTSELKLDHISNKDEVKILNIARRIYRSGFYDEIFKIRWGWKKSKVSWIIEILNFIYVICHPVFPMINWIKKIIYSWGVLRARIFIKKNKKLADEIYMDII